MWWKKSLDNLINLYYKGNADLDFIRDWAVAYEFETGDISLRDIESLDELFFIFYKTIPRSNSKSKSRSLLNNNYSCSGSERFSRRESASSSVRPSYFGGNRSYSRSKGNNKLARSKSRSTPITEY